MKSKYTLFSLVSLAVLVLDQVTKWYIDRTMDLHTSIIVFENFFQITYIRNKGAAFGIFADSSFRLPFFIIVSIAAFIFILYYLYHLRNEQRFATVSMALIFSGAVGNFIDRVRLGEVIDFLYVHWYQHFWPAFNVADSAICVGVGLLAVEMIIEERRKRKTA